VKPAVLHLANGARLRFADAPGNRRGLLAFTGRTGYEQIGDRMASVLEHGSKEKAQPLYAAYPLTQISADALAGWAATWGIPLVMDPHVTVAYSKAPVMKSKVPPTSAGLIVPPGQRTVERFGDAIVLCLDCPELQKRHAEYLGAGASWDHPSYRPHITLAYDDGFMGPTDETLISAFDEPITLDAEFQQDLMLTEAY